VIRDGNNTLRLVVLASGSGRSLVNLDARIRKGRLNAAIIRVISSRSDAPVVARARERGLPVVVVERSGLDDQAFQRELTQAVRGSPFDLACMAGFLWLWRIPDDLIGRVINMHPALLPDFGGVGMYGDHVHRAVLGAGCTESGCTVHYCDNEYDHGPIILQRRVAIPAGCTPEKLAELVFEQECAAYPEALEILAERLGRRTIPDHHG